MASKSNESPEVKKEEVSGIKKPLIKNNSLFALILIIGLVAAIILFVVKFAMYKVNGGDSDNGSAQQTWQKIADNLSYMIESSDLQIVYKSSDKRNIIYLIGSNGYYSVQYNNNNIYVAEGTYSVTTTTDEAKIAEATTNINSNKGQKIYASDVSSFTVDTSNAKTSDQDFYYKQGDFNAGTLGITFGIDQNSVNKRDTITVTIP